MEKCIRGSEELRKYLKDRKDNPKYLDGNGIGYYYQDELGNWNNTGQGDNMKVVSFADYFKQIDRSLIIEYNPFNKKEVDTILEILESYGEKVYEGFKERPYRSAFLGITYSLGSWLRVDKNYPTNITASDFIKKYSQSNTNTTMKNAVQPTTVKPMSVTKTETVLIGKKKREITITVLTDESDPYEVRAGYSVRNPEDKKSNPELGKQISIGRAMSDKTNMVDMYLGEGMQNKKYILYAIAEQLFRELSSGTRKIKGVK